jgi:hypothetical protein
MERPPTPPQPRAISPLLIVGIVVLAVAVVYLLWRGTREPAPVVAEAPPAQVQPAPQPAPEPEIRHPIEAVPAEPLQRAEPLPSREESDAALVEVMTALVGKAALMEYFVPEELVRRFVTTVDNLPRESLPMRVRAVKATPGAFVVAGPETERSIHADNARRYEPFVRFIEGLDARTLVSIYVHFYPLLREEYRSLGFPTKQFNDRVVEAIDDLLAAPEPEGPVALVQPKVMYKFADPELESLSAGRKIMIRIGTDNARRLKAKLREMRQVLAGPPATR